MSSERLFFANAHDFIWFCFTNRKKTPNFVYNLFKLK